MSDMTEQQLRKMQKDRLAARLRRKESARRRYKQQYDRRHNATRG